MYRLVFKNGKPDAKRAGCMDCYHCRRSGRSWWCTQGEAGRAHGTIEPSYNRLCCFFWAPIQSVKELGWFERFFGDFIKVDLDKINKN